MPQTTKIKNLTVPSGSNVSNIMDANGFYDGAYGIMIYAPAALPEAAGTIEVTDDAAPTAAGSTWRTLQDDTPADVAYPAAGKARLYLRLPFANGFRIKLGGNAAADRVFAVTLIAD